MSCLYAASLAVSVIELDAKVTVVAQKPRRYQYEKVEQQATEQRAYVITDASGVHYAIAAKTLKSSLSKSLSKTLRGAPKVVKEATSPPRKRAAGPT